MSKLYFALSSTGDNNGCLMKRMPITQLIITALASFSLSAGAVHAQTLLAHYQLNDGPAGTEATTINDSSANGVNLTSVGLKWTADGAGVGGTGIALYDSAIQSNYNQRASNTSTGTTFDGLTSYTVTGWINMSSAQAGGRLLSIASGDGSAVMQIYLNDDYLRIQNTVESTTARKDSGTYTMLNQGWVFFAMAIDSTQASFNDAVKFYFGTETDAASLLGNASGSVGNTSGLAMDDSSTIVLGNSYNAGTSANNRAIIDTTLSDIQIYGSTSGSSGALSAPEIESIRQSSIPESSSVSLLLGLAAAGLLSMRLVRSKKHKQPC